jgi:hypothetical protein
MWLLWVAAAVYGERKRAISRKAAVNKEVDDGSPPPYNPNKEHYAYVQPKPATGSFANKRAGNVLSLKTRI